VFVHFNNYQTRMNNYTIEVINMSFYDDITDIKRMVDRERKNKETN